MSTNYAPYCVTCQSEHYVSDDRQLELCRVLIHHGPALQAAGRTVASVGAEVNGYGYWEPDFRVAGDGVRLDWAWWAEHGNHELAVRNEYGDLDGECALRYDCGLCGQQRKCARPKGHLGEHQDKRDIGGRSTESPPEGKK